MTRVSLDVLAGPAAGQSLDVPPEGLLLGRSDNLAGDPTVSQQHADVTWTSDGFLAVRDLGSTNGTYINDTLITGRTILRAGDRLTLGETVLAVALPEEVPAGEKVSLEGGQHAEHGGVVAGVIHGGVRTIVDTSGLSTFVQARGIARFLIVLGTALAIAGVACWGYPIVSAITESASSFGDFSAQERCEDQFGGTGQIEELNRCLREASRANAGGGFDATPWLPLGAILFLAGAACTIAGTLMIRRAPD